MYANKYDAEVRDEVRFSKKLVLWVIGLLAVISIGSWMLTKSVQIADNALLNYEQFQEIYNTCDKINTDLGTIRAVDEKDRMFDSFSKQAMLANKKQQLARWVEEYNAKSKMWNRSLWKSNSLPYQLNVNQFQNFN
jgi:hypothetical protein